MAASYSLPYEHKSYLIWVAERGRGWGKELLSRKGIRSDIAVKKNREETCQTAILDLQFISKNASTH